MVSFELFLKAHTELRSASLLNNITSHSYLSSRAIYKGIKTVLIKVCADSGW